MSSNDHGPSVAIADLRADAQTWRERGAALAGLSQSIRDVALDSDRLGVFALAGQTHNSLAEQLSQQCAESSAAAERLSADLTHAADTYERAEEESTRGLHGIGQQIERGNP
ncbi:MAG: hypothetical protein ACRC20_03005 [Segniliparus sp.]|uniref:hypothetical protein n=1 Tax=Segniliparus sp. TaxID=2804064 RepID=UPI003F3B631D